MKIINKSKIVLLLILTSFILQSYTTVNPADRIIGYWMTKNNMAQIKIYRQNDKYYGKIIWADEMYESDGKTLKRDTKNADPGKRNQTIKNLIILSNFSYKNEIWTEGTIYDPENGSTYSCKMELNGSKLEIRGYIGFSLFGRTEIWNRAEKPIL